MSVYETNIELIKKKNLYLFERLKSIDTHNVSIMSSKSGKMTAKYKDIFISSMYNPIDEAKARISRINRLENCTMLICLGFGLGYEIEQIIDRLPERSAVVVVITDIEVFTSTIQHIDLSKILQFDRLAIIDGTNENIREQFSEISKNLIYFTAQVEYFVHPVIGKLNKEAIERSMQSIKDTIISRVIHTGNSAEDSIIGLDATIANFSNIIRTPDISKYKGYFKGIPAICVAAGPSLEKNIQYLAEAQGKAAIFAVETILDRLRKEEIEFNFASVIERTDNSYELHFKDKPLEDDVVLLADSVVYNNILDEHKGKNIVIMRDTTYVESAISQKLNNLNSLDIGISAAHLSFAVAAFLGFSPIILVGQDLAYGEDGEDHADGTVYQDPEHNVESIQTFGIIGDEVYLKGSNGGLVRSTIAWKIFLEMFVTMIKKEQVFCINATEGGAYIEGTELLTLKDAIDTYCKKEIGFEISSKFTSPSKSEIRKRAQLFLEEIDSQASEAKVVLELCKNIKIVLDKFIKENCVLNNKYDIIQYAQIIESAINQIISFKMPSFIVQSITVNAVRKNKSLGQLEDIKSVKEWYENNFIYFNTVEKIMEIMIENYRKRSYSLSLAKENNVNEQ